MTEIAQLFESALRSNRTQMLRSVAIETLSRMPRDATLRELLESEAGPAIRELTLAEFREVLGELPGIRRRLHRTVPAATRRRRVVAAESAQPTSGPSSDEERIYREILDALVDGPLTIGQLAKRMGRTSDEIRGYVKWMRKMGKVESEGRARATRYFLPKGQ
ncbi:MAG: ArsR family transcriptional regulator [Deltaproteobacteria bacterium]|nr:MAG: ArsR family transcriptional regulator [Deltaproteobacteria bacterium]